MDINTILNIFLHLDTYLVTMITNYGVFIYAIIFIVIFCETGLVVTPFLPGDSLLFAAGALASGVGALNIWVLLIVITMAAILGDTLNYFIGKYAGTKAFGNGDSKIFKKEYLNQTENFYAKHGDKAIVLGRFFPVIRTFVPFVAGIGKMDYPKFVLYNIIGAIIWVAVFLMGGYLFGNIEFVKNNFTLVISGIIVLSLTPGIYHLATKYVRKIPTV